MRTEHMVEADEVESWFGIRSQKTLITSVAIRRWVVQTRPMLMLVSSLIVCILACVAVTLVNPAVAQLTDTIFTDRFEVLKGRAACTVGNWSMASGLSDANTGTQGSDNRRYGGPCALRVPVDGTARYVSDDSPGGEGSYTARFYVFLDDADNDPILIFAADDGLADQIQIWYNEPAPGDLTLRVYDASAAPTDLTLFDLSSGWHSIEFAWSADATAEIAFSVDGAADEIRTVNTSGIAISNAHLGNVSGANTGGSIDFDDFVSRRIQRPGRLVVGDANDDGIINIADIIAIADEIGDLGFAPGQPDCNGDGEIDSSDIACIVDILDSQ